MVEVEKHEHEWYPCRVTRLDRIYESYFLIESLCTNEKVNCDEKRYDLLKAYEVN